MLALMKQDNPAAPHADILRKRLSECIRQAHKPIRVLF